MFRDKVFWPETVFVRQTVELAQTDARSLTLANGTSEHIVSRPEMSKIIPLITSFSLLLGDGGAV